MPKRTNQLGTIAAIVTLLATFAGAIGGYYDVRARGEQTAVSLQQLRDKQEKFEAVALARWGKVDDVLDQLLTRGIRNETKIDAILESLREHVFTQKGIK